MRLILIKQWKNFVTKINMPQMKRFIEEVLTLVHKHTGNEEDNNTLNLKGTQVVSQGDWTT